MPTSKSDWYKLLEPGLRSIFKSHYGGRRAGKSHLTVKNLLEAANKMSDSALNITQDGTGHAIYINQEGNIAIDPVDKRTKLQKAIDQAVNELK